MIFCEYCGSPTDLVSAKEFKYNEIFNLPLVVEEHRKCQKCFNKFYVLFEANKYNNNKHEQSN